MLNEQELDSLSAGQLRALARVLIDQAVRGEALLADKERELKYRRPKFTSSRTRWPFSRAGNLGAAASSLTPPNSDC